MIIAWAVRNPDTKEILRKGWQQEGAERWTKHRPALYDTHKDACEAATIVGGYVVSVEVRT